VQATRWRSRYYGINNSMTINHRGLSHIVRLSVALQKHHCCRFEHLKRNNSNLLDQDAASRTCCRCIEDEILPCMWNKMLSLCALETMLVCGQRRPTCTTANFAAACCSQPLGTTEEKGKRNAEIAAVVFSQSTNWSLLKSGNSIKEHIVCFQKFPQEVTVHIFFVQATRRRSSYYGINHSMKINRRGLFHIVCLAVICWSTTVVVPNTRREITLIYLTETQTFMFAIMAKVVPQHLFRTQVPASVLPVPLPSSRARSQKTNVDICLSWDWLSHNICFPSRSFHKMSVYNYFLRRFLKTRALREMTFPLFNND